MNKIYLSIIKLFYNKELYLKYFKYLEQDKIKENYPELYKLLCCLTHIHNYGHDETTDSTSLKATLLTLYPRINLDDYADILQQIDVLESSNDVLESYLESAATRSAALDGAKLLLAFVDSGSMDGNIDALLKAIRPEGFKLEEPDSIECVTDSLAELYDERRKNVGLRWRLQSLNEALGSLKKGDFGFVFARPETGKTTFLASEISHMVSQTDSPIVWFNNEEQHSKVKVRIYQAILDKSTHELYGDIEGNGRSVLQLGGGRIKIPLESTLSRNYIDRVCSTLKPSLIIIDQIDKIQGFEADRHDLLLKDIYGWARELAKKYGPVIGVCQAGSTGDGKKWLTMNDVDSSHTAKQGEADWILGIGKTYEEGFEEVRYMHLSKNKLEGDADTNPEYRHRKWEVRIDPIKSRYSDF